MLRRRKSNTDELNIRVPTGRIPTGRAPGKNAPLHGITAPTSDRTTGPGPTVDRRAVRPQSRSSRPSSAHSHGPGPSSRSSPTPAPSRNARSTPSPGPDLSRAPAPSRSRPKPPNYAGCAPCQACSRTSPWPRSARRPTAGSRRNRGRTSRDARFPARRGRRAETTFWGRLPPVPACPCQETPTRAPAVTRPDTGPTGHRTIGPHGPIKPLRRGPTSGDDRDRSPLLKQSEARIKHGHVADGTEETA